MIKNYFALNEDFKTIINNALPNNTINSINCVTTGWTNIVFEVCTNNNENFFFRFPRDDFWIRTIVKDYEFTKFIYGKTDFNTVKLELLYDNNRPFSMHKKIEGTVLAEKLNTMTEAEIKIISQDIAKFMFQLHNLKFSFEEIFQTQNIGLKLTDFLDELLNVHVAKEDMKFWNYNELINKDPTCLVHGDLNSSNIIIDENNHISAIIDFGFGGFGNKYFDIARIVGRNSPKNFKDEVIKNYENISNNQLDCIVLNNLIDTWTNIDNAYINYMRKIGIYN